MNATAPAAAVSTTTGLRTQTLLIAMCGGLTLFGSGAQDNTIWLHYFFKPLTTLLIFSVAWQGRPPVSARYRSAVLLGMLCSLAGDIFLMLPRSVLAGGFLFGLASFLCAHLCFLRALTSDSRLFAKPTVFLLIGTLGALNLLILWPGLSAGLRLPVLAYVACLLTMSAQAVTRHACLRTPTSRMAAVGGLLFMLSDTLLAYNRFYTQLPYSALLILGSYYPALWCIANSVKARPSTHPSTL
ncbi:MAG: lysoplasmalogenase [Pseudomonadota bacterium]